ncbi:protein of unknown function [Shewanella benthica]|uniref:Uncharacterized protein n=1 Tax=Shewanella benthica TaxID=43661 RepID=A0A330M7C1_9GAMM|nr:protein of unknown function [Shewanella benthica]
MPAALPLVLAGPTLHHCDQDNFTLWFVSSAPMNELTLYLGEEKLIPIFDKLNGWLYGHFSPLNFLTKRKRMSIRGRRPNGERSKRLMNQSGIGLLSLANNGARLR